MSSNRNTFLVVNKIFLSENKVIKFRNFMQNLKVEEKNKNALKSK